MDGTVDINVSFSTIWFIAGLLAVAAILMAVANKKIPWLFTLGYIIWIGAIFWLLYYALSVGLTLGAVWSSVGLSLPALVGLIGLAIGLFLSLGAIARK